MARLALPTPHRLAITLSLVLTLAVAMPQPAWGKHHRPIARISLAKFVAGFGHPAGFADPADPPFAHFTSPHTFSCTWLESPLHDYQCSPSPIGPLGADPWPLPFQLKHILWRGGLTPPTPPGGGWTGLASPAVAPQFLCVWDGNNVPLAELAEHYNCSFSNPQRHTFTVAEIVSVCDEEVAACNQRGNDPALPLGECETSPPCAPPYRLDAAGATDFFPLDGWYPPDIMPPDTSIAAGPSGRVAPEDVILSFGSSENGSTFACRLDGGNWEECAASQAYPDLGDGRHSIEVRATDAASNVDSTPAARAWEVDGTPPDTRLLRGPGRTTRDRTPRFRFAASEPTATFACRLDGRPFTRCRSPHTVRPLADGRYAFIVRASDSVGNDDASPARRGFTVDTTGPRLRISRRTLRLTPDGLAVLPVRCPRTELSGPCAGRLRLKTADRVNVGAGRRIVTLGKSGLRLDRGRRGLVEIELTRGARSLVGQLNRVEVRAVARLRDRVGNVATTRQELVVESP